jgi:hypothetical protein
LEAAESNAVNIDDNIDDNVVDVPADAPDDNKAADTASDTASKSSAAAASQADAQFKFLHNPWFSSRDQEPGEDHCDQIFQIHTTAVAVAEVM